MAVEVAEKNRRSFEYTSAFCSVSDTLKMCELNGRLLVRKRCSPSYSLWFQLRAPPLCNIDDSGQTECSESNNLLVVTLD